MCDDGGEGVAGSSVGDSGNDFGGVVVGMLVVVVPVRMRTEVVVTVAVAAVVMVAGEVEVMREQSWWE